MPHFLILMLLVCCILESVQAAETAPMAKVEVIDLTRDGSYTSGAWTYRIRVHNPGTRSQATVGTLTRDGKDVPVPDDGKPVDSPWGQMTWNGERGTLENGSKPWGDFGWRPVAQAKTKEIKAGSVAEEEHIQKE